MNNTSTTSLPPVSPILLRLFYFYCRHYIRRRFHAVRIMEPGFAPGEQAPAVIYLNHPSWWDPLICLVLANRFFPGRIHYAPIDAKELDRYRFFARLGFFGVEAGTFRGAAKFLKISRKILETPRATLWLTPEGRFSDPRRRPTRISPGLGHLAVRMKQGTMLPLALEYPFWQERQPEALVGVGDPLTADEFSHLDPTTSTDLLSRKLEETQDRLAGAARKQQPGDFSIVLGGTAGVGGVYDLWRRLKSLFRGEKFNPEHRPKKR